MRKRFLFPKILLITLAATALLTGCGGGGSSSDAASASAAAKAAEKTSVRAHLNDVYLWYNQIVDVPAANYATAPDYFDALLVRSMDRFSFSMPVAEAVSQLQVGEETGFGVKWGWAAQGRLYAYYVDPNSPAAATFTRGTEVTAINGQAVATMDSSTLDNALFPQQAGSQAAFTLRAPGAVATQTKSLASATFLTTAVAQPQILPLSGGRKAGYLLFNEHLLTSEGGLNQAMTQFKQQGISELVLDLRYNNGGYLMIAEEVASMIGGTPVQGKVFEKLSFNNKHPEKTQDPTNTIKFDALDSKDATLPLLGLNRVFVLTGPPTCSASESIVNGLLPYVQVVLIGGTTCGKPYGFVQTNIGDQAYFAIQMEGVNASGNDDFKTGFAPTCPVDDDLNYQLGDVREARLKAALYYMSNNSCPAYAAAPLPKTAPSATVPPAGEPRMLGLRPGLKLVR